jgi:tetratricopeptide (TPR) repeat protein
MNKLKVAFFTANPDPKRSEIAAGEEYLRVHAKLQASPTTRDVLQFLPGVVTTWDDVRDVLNRERPQVVHFTTHGEDEKHSSRPRLLLVGRRSGQPEKVGPQELVQLFRDRSVRLVVLNACQTWRLAAALQPLVDSAIGVKGEIPDEAAICFAVDFYAELASGASVQKAFHAGRKVMSARPAAWLGLKFDLHLVPRQGVDPTALVLATPMPVCRPRWTVPYPRNEFFQGREAIIAGLQKHLTQRRKAALAQAISGLGGIGKTQTAVEYAYRYRDRYNAVLWLNAESTLGLKTRFAELAALLDLPYPEKDVDAAVLAVKDWLKTETRWLLILDNADDPGLLTPFLPEAEHGHILITSRAQDFQDLGIMDPVGLEELSIDDATAFLLHRCGRQDADAAERAAATDLARELDGLPLALEQAAAYIVERRATFRRYLESYRTRGLRLVEERLSALGRYTKSVATTWTANFEAVEVESPAAADVLRFSAILASDAIPFELLAGGASQLGPPVEQALTGAAENPLLIHDLLGPLGRFSLIRSDGHTEVYSIHRMVQEVLKAGMDDATRRLWAERAVRAVNQAFPVVKYENWSLYGRLLPHALAIADWIKHDSMKFEEAGRLLNETAYYLHERGQYPEAQPLLEQAMAIRRETLGERHPSYATSLNNLAGLYGAMGRHAEAQPLYLQATEISRTALGERHPDYATSLNNLAELYRAMGRYAEAQPLYLQATAIRREALGERHPDYADSLNNLALLYRAMGRHAEAQPLYQQAMAIRRETLGERHPDYADSLNNLAGLYGAMGRHAEAEPLYLQAMVIRREALGERHPDYANSLNNLAGLYGAMGRHAEAEPLYLQATAIRREVLGERHPDYANSLNNLAGLYGAMGRYAEAQPLLEQATAIRREILGERHPHYATSLNNLAWLYFEMGRHAEAEPLYLQATAIRREALGERHPHYATSLNNLAELYGAMGRHAEAQPLYQQAMAIRREALGERHPDYADSLNNLAGLYRVMGRHAEAEPLYRQATEISRTALSERHPDYAKSLNNLAGLYRVMGRHAEAEPLLEQVMAIYREALGERHPDYATSLNNLALLYYAMGRHAGAEPLLEQVMAIRRTALGERHPSYAASLNNLAGLYYALGRYPEAEPLLEQVMAIRREALGERHPDYAKSLNDLALLYGAMGRHAEAEALSERVRELRRMSQAGPDH